MDDYDLPFWLQIPVQDYRRWLNRQAVALAKADRKRGGSYRVREAMQSIHRACHACDGHDPYDGLPLRGGLLLPSAQSDQHQRCPAVGHRQPSPVADFEILSHQTKQAKGQLSAEDYLAHCRAVVQQAERRQPS